MDDDGWSWESGDESETPSWCSGVNTDEQESTSSSEFLFDAAAFEATEKKYADILSEVRAMRECLPPTPNEEGAWKPGADNIPSGYPRFGLNPFIQHAMDKMRRFDVLLEVIEEKEKEERHNTSKLQLQFRKEIESECIATMQNEFLARHTQKFLKLCSLDEKEEVEEEKKSEKRLRERTKSSFGLDVISEEPVCSYQTPNRASTEGADPSCPSKEDAGSHEQPNKPQMSVGSGDTTHKKRDADGARRKQDQRFIERNIKLVTDSQKVGKSAITEKERKQLDKLLQNLTTADTDESEKLQSSDNADNPEGFAISVEKMESLEGINSKLEEMNAERDRPKRDNDPYFLKEQDQVRGWKELQMKQRLKEINQSLSAISETTLQEIPPVEETKIQQLLRIGRECRSCASLTTLDTGSTCGTVSSAAPSVLSHPTTPDELRGCSNHSHETEKPLNDETLAKLLEEAKNQMPRFQYRHTQHVDKEEEKTEEKEEKVKDKEKVEE